MIVHELLHLRYRDHGKLFKAMMSAMVPNWRELENAESALHRAPGDGSLNGGCR